MKVLVTGGAGFIGSHLVRELASSDQEVVVLDNLLAQIHGANAVFPEFNNKVKCIKGDIRDTKLIAELLQNNFDLIYHFVALTGVGQSMYEIKEYIDVTSLGTAVLLNEIVKRKHRPKKIILASSRAVYGEGEVKCRSCGLIFNPLSRDPNRLSKNLWEHACPSCGLDSYPVASTERTPLKPISVYGVAKQNQEQLWQVVAQAYDLSYTILRYFNVYGPGQSSGNPYTGVLSIFCRRLLQGKPIDVYEDGQESRDFIYVDDVTQANILAGKSDVSGTFNICSGEVLPILSVASILQGLIKRKDYVRIIGGYRIGDIRHGIGSYQLAADILKFQPKISIQEGLARLVDWMANQKSVELADLNLDQIATNEMRERGLFKEK